MVQQMSLPEMKDATVLTTGYLPIDMTGTEPWSGGAGMPEPGTYEFEVGAICQENAQKNHLFLAFQVVAAENPEQEKYVGSVVRYYFKSDSVGNKNYLLGICEKLAPAMCEQKNMLAKNNMLMLNWKYIVRDEKTGAAGARFKAQVARETYTAKDGTQKERVDLQRNTIFMTQPSAFASGGATAKGNNAKAQAQAQAQGPSMDVMLPQE